MYCSKKCQNKAMVTRARRRRKQRLVELAGGCCQLCGYDKSLAALQFHHPNSDKEFNLSSPNTRKWEELVLEAEKCLLVCANCHAEEHERLRIH